MSLTKEQIEQRSPERQGNPNANRVCEFASCPFGLPAGHRIKDHPMPPPEAGRCSTVKGDTRCRREPHASGPHEFDHTRVEAPAVAETPLTWDLVLSIARGCIDYGGGYRSDDEKLAIFHHGIQTVVNALENASRNGLKDTQVAALYVIGRGINHDHQ